MVQAEQRPHVHLRQTRGVPSPATTAKAAAAVAVNHQRSSEPQRADGPHECPRRFVWQLIQANRHLWNNPAGLQSIWDLNSLDETSTAAGILSTGLDDIN